MFNRIDRIERVYRRRAFKSKTLLERHRARSQVRFGHVTQKDFRQIGTILHGRKYAILRNNLEL